MKKATKKLKKAKGTKKNSKKKSKKESKEAKIETVKNPNIIVSSEKTSIKTNPFHKEEEGGSEFFQVGIMANAMDFEKAPQDSLSFSLEQELQEVPTTSNSNEDGVDYASSKKDYFEVSSGEFAAENIDVYQTNNGEQSYAQYDSSVATQQNNEEKRNPMLNSALERSGFVDPYSNPNNNNNQNPSQIPPNPAKNYDSDNKAKKVTD